MSLECKRSNADTLERLLYQSLIKRGAFVRGGVCPRGICPGAFVREALVRGAFVLPTATAAIVVVLAFRISLLQTAPVVSNKLQLRLVDPVLNLLM